MATAGRVFGSALLTGLRPCQTCCAMRWGAAMALPTVQQRRRLQRGSFGTVGLLGLHGEKGTRQWASKFVHQLTDRERKHLREAMRCYEQNNGGEESERLTKAQIRQVLLYNALPFIGFGFLDNAIMICAGEYIDYAFGTVLSISTMAAAALGNLVSDLFGVGLAGYVELLATRLGVSVPNITPAQHERKEARWASGSGRALGVSIGCVIGMFPLLFFREEGDDDGDTCNVPEHQAAAATAGTRAD